MSLVHHPVPSSGPLRFQGGTTNAVRHEGGSGEAPLFLVSGASSSPRSVTPPRLRSYSGTSDLLRCPDLAFLTLETSVRLGSRGSRGSDAVGSATRAYRPELPFQVSATLSGAGPHLAKEGLGPEIDVKAKFPLGRAKCGSELLLSNVTLVKRPTLALGC